MKKTLLLLITILLLISCKKEASIPSNETPDYYGIYFNNIGDTLYVSQGDGIYTKFQLSPKNEPNNRILFDSVKVSSDNTFTNNEKVYLYGNYSSIGIGYFGTNTVYFNFNIGGGTLIYNGVK